MSCARFSRGFSRNGVNVIGGMPVEIRQQQQDDDHAEPERRHREPGDRDHADHVVDPGVLVERGERPQRNRDQHREHGRHDRDLERELQPRRDLLRHRLAGPHRHAEIAGRHAAQPFAELDVDAAGRARGACAPARSRPARRSPPSPRSIVFDRIAAHDAQHQEHEDRDPEQRRDHQQQPLRDVAKHVSGPGERRSASMLRPIAAAARHHAAVRYRSSQTSVRSCPT